MPLAGQLADRHGVRRVFLVALVIFIVGLRPRGPRDEPRRADRGAARPGGRGRQPRPGRDRGGLAPVRRPRRGPRALGVVGARDVPRDGRGPVRGRVDPGDDPPDRALDSLGSRALADPWRYVFYLNVPIGIATLALGWAAMAGWATPRRESRLDLPGADRGVDRPGGAAARRSRSPAASPIEGLPIDPALAAPRPRARRRSARWRRPCSSAGGGRQPFVDARWFRSRAFASATLVSLLTGYGFATAIIGGAVFVDRVLYGGPDLQRVALGSLAAATAAGALVSGLALRALGLRRDHAHRARRGHRRARPDGGLDARDVDRRGRRLAGDLRAGLRADRHAALRGGGRGAGRAGVRRRVGGGDRGADDRHGDRARRADRVRLDDHRPALGRRSRRRRTRTRRSSRSRSGIGRSTTASSCRRSSSGPAARRPGSSSACSSWRPR